MKILFHYGKLPKQSLGPIAVPRQELGNEFKVQGSKFKRGGLVASV
jgi:hypothetical protein